MKKTAPILSIAAILALITSFVLTTPASAWNCKKYNFNVEEDGDVFVENRSNSNEPAQNARIYIDGELVATLAVPAMPKHTDWTLIGHVDVPEGGFTWEVVGTADCRDEGEYEPPPDYQLNLSHVECVNEQVEVHFVLLNVPDGITPGTLTYTYGTIEPGEHTGNVWHYTDYLGDGYYNITEAWVEVGGETVTLHNPGEYAGDYDCAPDPTPTPETPTPTPVTPTATSTPETPTATPVTPTETPEEPTPTNTPETPTPTNTPVTPTETPEDPTATPVTPSATPVTPTETPEGPTPTPVTPTATSTPETPTATPVTPTETPEEPTPTNTPETPTPTNTPVTPTETPEDPTATPVTPTATPTDGPTPTATSTPPEIPPTGGGWNDFVVVVGTLIGSTLFVMLGIARGIRRKRER